MDFFFFHFPKIILLSTRENSSWIVKTTCFQLNVTNTGHMMQIFFVIISFVNLFIPLGLFFILFIREDASQSLIVVDIMTVHFFLTPLI